MRTKPVERQHALLAFLLALALAFGLCPTSALAADDVSAGADVSSAAVAVADEAAADGVANLAVYGPDGSGTSAWLPLSEWSFEKGATAADLTRALFEANGIEVDIQESDYGLYLNSITGSDGTVYGYDAETGAYWGLYVNGVSSDVGMSSVELQPGDTVVWYYGPYATELPNVAPEGFAPDAPLAPSDDVAWGSFGGDAAGVAAGELPLSQAGADLSWTQGLLRTEGSFANVSSLLVVDGLVYVAESDSVWTATGSTVTNAVLRAFDAQTGELKKSADLPYAIDSACRMAYADGVIAVPVSGGGLLGVSADTLQPRWHVASGLADSAQSLNGVTAYDGYFVHASAELGEGWAAAASSLVRVNARTGALAWRLSDEVGSYWSGAAVVNGVVLLGTDAGTLRAVDFETGAELSDTVVAEGARVRSEIVPCGGSEVVFSTTAGELVKARVTAEGAVAVTGRAQFAASSTGTPAIVGGVAVVGGATADFAGVLAEVDLAAMTVVAKHDAIADVKSAPVAAQGADGLWYAYFTCNSKPGALYGVRLGDGSPEPFTVCEPAAEDQNYCMASAAADGEGHLFYANDSGVLFAVEHDATCGFSDVAESDWVVREGMLERVVSLGLMKGKGDGCFDPWASVTRGEMVTVLHRAAGEPAALPSGSFADVQGDAYYADAVAWAQAEGIVSGFGDGTFRPDAQITREQLAKMLAEYARHVGGVAVSDADPSALNALSGSDDASSWAREGLAWCCDEGVLSGSERDGVLYLDPQGTADRAMTAKMIVKALEAIG